MPFIRGRILPEIKNAGFAKRTLSVLLNLESTSRPSVLASLDELEHLRIYLASLDARVSIELLCPEGHSKTRSMLGQIGIDCRAVPVSNHIDRIPRSAADHLDGSLKGLLATALEWDADCVVSDNPALLPYVEEFVQCGVLLTSADFLLRYAEAFARGHDVPWSFDHKVWFEPWIAFYQLSEQSTFESTMNFLALCQSKGVDAETVELCRSLVYNRLSHLCFTRD